MNKCAQEGCEKALASLTLQFGRWWCESHRPCFDPVERPRHYANMGIEPIDVLEAWLTLDEFVAHCKASAIAYLARAGKKEGESLEQDLAKARWFVDRAHKAVTK
jgi:hypothetical protein